MKHKKPRKVTKKSSMATGAVLLVGMVIGGFALALQLPPQSGIFNSFDLTQQENQITLTWSLSGPTQNVELYVYRGAEEITTLPGEATSYTHTEAEFGIVRYTVTAFSKDKHQFLGQAYDLAYLGRLTWDKPRNGPISSFQNTSQSVWSINMSCKPCDVFFDGVLGSEQATLAEVDLPLEWFCDGNNVLSIFSVSDPEQLYANPGIEYCHLDGFYIYIAEGPGDPYNLLPYQDPTAFTYDAGNVTEVSLSTLHSNGHIEGNKQYYLAASTYLTVNSDFMVSALTDPVELVNYAVEVAEPIYPPQPPMNFNLKF